MSLLEHIKQTRRLIEDEDEDDVFVPRGVADRGASPEGEKYWKAVEDAKIKVGDRVEGPDDREWIVKAIYPNKQAGIDALKHLPNFYGNSPSNTSYWVNDHDMYNDAEAFEPWLYAVDVDGEEGVGPRLDLVSQYVKVS